VHASQKKFKNKIKYIFKIFIFFLVSARMQPCVRADSREEGGRGGRGGEGREGEGRGGRCIRADTHVRVDASASARTHGRVCADAPCFTLGNFKKDA
jgi:hypothetical protein